MSHMSYTGDNRTHCFENYVNVKESDLSTAYAKGMYDEREKWEKKMSDMLAEITRYRTNCYQNQTEDFRMCLNVIFDCISAIIHKYLDKENELC